MMKKILLIMVSLSFCGLLVAQNNEAEPELVDGVMNGNAPSDAVVLFDGSNLDAWHIASSEEAARWEISEGIMTVRRGVGTIKTKQRFGDIQLHVEWRPTAEIEGDGQARGNSGIFLNSLYEVQILDSWQNPTYSNGQAASIYLQHTPLVNAAKPPGQWQSYDISFKAPIFSADGALESPAFVTLVHNGVVVQNNVEILGSTYTEEPEYSTRCVPYSQERETDCSGRMPITLQDHGQVVSFRNIWVREL